jgi:alkylation response protein AidB-like acyl-CoA dehydrogenase
MQTTAVRVGDEYVINGEKVWTSYAAEAEFCFLLARSDPDSIGNRGISVFLVPTDSPGFTIEPIPSVLDIHEYNRLTFDNVRVPVSARLGEENDGWRVVREALSHERIGGPRYARAALVTERLRRNAAGCGAMASKLGWPRPRRHAKRPDCWFTTPSTCAVKNVQKISRSVWLV